MDDSQPIVAAGTGWFATLRDGRLHVTITDPEVTLVLHDRRRSMTVVMPADFVTELIRNKRALRGTPE